MDLARVSKVHSLVSALADERCRCIWPRRRAVSRLWLDVKGGVSARTISDAWRMGLVTTSFENPYIVGHGEEFIGLSGFGALVVRATPSDASQADSNIRSGE